MEDAKVQDFENSKGACTIIAVRKVFECARKQVGFGEIFIYREQGVSFINMTCHGVDPTSHMGQLIRSQRSIRLMSTCDHKK